MQTYKTPRNLVNKETIEKYFSGIPNPEKFNVSINHKNTTEWIVETNLVLDTAQLEDFHALRG